MLAGLAPGVGAAVGGDGGHGVVDEVDGEVGRRLKGPHPALGGQAAGGVDAEADALVLRDSQDGGGGAVVEAVVEAVAVPESEVGEDEVLARAVGAVVEDHLPGEAAAGEEVQPDEGLVERRKENVFFFQKEQFEGKEGLSIFSINCFCATGNY